MEKPRDPSPTRNGKAPTLVKPCSNDEKPACPEGSTSKKNSIRTGARTNEKDPEWQLSGAGMLKPKRDMSITEEVKPR